MSGVCRLNPAEQNGRGNRGVANEKQPGEDPSGEREPRRQLLVIQA